MQSEVRAIRALDEDPADPFLTAGQVVEELRDLGFASREQIHRLIHQGRIASEAVQIPTWSYPKSCVRASEVRRFRGLYEEVARVVDD